MRAMGLSSLEVLKLVAWLCCLVGVVSGIGVNWGLQASHPLPPSIVVQMLKDNGIEKIKLFDAQDNAMSALADSGIQVMVGIPNDMLVDLAGSEKDAANYVSKNISKYIKDGVDIRYVAVGNEPFLTTLNGTYLNSTFPAMQNIQSALVSAGLNGKVKVTVPLNADVYQSQTGKPSDGDFRADIHDLMVAVVKFLNDNAAPVTANIYPFISLHDDPNFPADYAFFDGSSSPIIDGTNTYSNVFDANYDTLVAALQKNGFGNLSIIVGEIGWPTDGDMNANPQYAQKFNQGFINHISAGTGTPLRPGTVDAYLFSLIDEDEKSTIPGNFERHWGIFAYDGSVKYALNLKTTNSGALVPAKNVKYLKKKWCVLKSSADVDDQQIAPSVQYACEKADCSSLGYKTSCGDLDTRGNLSYAFNNYYQKNNQDERACNFSGLATVTLVDPSNGTCKFEIMIQAGAANSFKLKTIAESLFSLFMCFIPPLMFILL